MEIDYHIGKIYLFICKNTLLSFILFLGAAMSGITADARTLVEHARVEGNDLNI